MSPDHERDREDSRSSNRYPILVGVAFLALIAVAALNTLRTDEGGLLGADPTEAGAPLPEFAVPKLLGGADADANIFQDDCETAENPCPADARRTPACRVELPRVIRVCDLFARPSVISFWFPNPADCPPTQDDLDRVARRFRGRVNFLSVAVRGEREELERIVENRGWRIPVGWDRDGAVSNLYRVGVCPTVAFVLPGGLLAEAGIGREAVSGPALRRTIARLIERSRRRAEESR
jgi:hypothetical protein